MGEKACLHQHTTPPSSALSGNINGSSPHHAPQPANGALIPCCYGGAAAGPTPIPAPTTHAAYRSLLPATNGPNPSLGNGMPVAKKSPNGTNGVVKELPEPCRRRSLWYEEEVNEDLRWCFSLSSILHTGVSKYQDIALLDTRPFGKVLLLDGKMQSAEADEFVYHECLVHPGLLSHASPTSVFIMGGGEGSTAREALRHRSVRRVVMCDIDKEVVAFCRAHLSQNNEAFQSSRLELVINDARAELETREERFDIIVGDLADPMEGGPCYQLYSKGFYENVVKPRLNPGGILITQAGPAGVWSHGEVFSSIYNTLRHVFEYVEAYTTHIPSYADTWGWVMASDHPLNKPSAAEEIDDKIRKRIKGELRYVDGETILGLMRLNKLVRRTLASETHVYTEESARFVYGRGSQLH